MKLDTFLGPGRYFPGWPALLATSLERRAGYLREMERAPGIVKVGR